MSHLWNQKLSFWKDLETKFRGTSVTHTQGNLHLDDQRTIQDGLFLWCALLDDLATAPLGGISPTFSIEMLVHDLRLCMKHHKIDRLFDTLKEIDSGILSSQFRDLDVLEYGFKHLIRDLPKGMRWLPRAIFNHVRWEDPIQGLSLTHQICCFPLRLNLRMKSFEDTCLADWLLLQESLSPVYPSDRLKSIIQGWMKKMDTLVSLRPKHGSGVTHLGNLRSTACKQSKYSSMEITPLMEFVNRRYCDDRLSTPFDTPVEKEPSSKWAAVPKSYSGYRSIAMEPPSKMWYQQAGMDAISQLLRCHPYLSRRINLRDASRNALLAQEGSQIGRYSTIDLALASDRVTWTLVKECFRRTILYPLLVAGRTRTIQLPDSTCVEAKCHATMGSALCFPIQCIIFAGIVEESILGLGGSPRRSNFLVYGDDIVVESRFTEAVISNLENYGFVVNQDKTFSDRSLYIFRESCGAEFINGRDVTPLRLSRFFTGKTGSGMTPRQFSSSIELANRAKARGHRLLRNLVIRDLLQLPKHLQPLFGNEGDGGVVWSDNPSNYHLSVHKRLSADYQREVFVHGSAGVDMPVDPSSMHEYTLFEWFVQSNYRSELQNFDTPPLGVTVSQSKGIRIRSLRS